MLHEIAPNGRLVEAVDQAIYANAHCGTELIARSRSFAVLRGPSGDRELLAFLQADCSCSSYWYGHVFRDASRGFVALIVWSTVLVDASDVPLLFERFHYWMRVRLEYQPCCVQNHDDAYAEAESFADAVAALIRMIRRFDIDKRWGDEDGPYGESPPDYRIIGVYGMENHRDANGCYPPVPTRKPLGLAGGFPWS